MRLVFASSMMFGSRNSSRYEHRNISHRQTILARPKKLTTTLSIKYPFPQDYIEAHQDEDYLVKGFENCPKKNPFRKKKFNSCSLF